MTNRDPTKLLKELSQNAAVKTATCPDDHEMARFVEGQLYREDAESIRKHLADCDYCIHQVGLLGRMPEDDTEPLTPEFVLARAKRLVKAKNLLQKPEIGQWAAAAVLVLAVLSVSMWSERKPFTGPVESETFQPLPNVSQETGQVRNIGSNTYIPKILTPAENTVVAPEDLLVRWTESTDAIYYEVRVVSDEGGLIWQQRIEGRDEARPGSIGLQPGREYFVRVDAYLAEARKLSSHHVPFTAGE